MPRQFISACCIALMLAAACPVAPAQSATLGDEYALTASELASLKRQATRGNAGALDRVIQFYTLFAPDLQELAHWQRVGAQRGDVGHMLNLATSLAGAGSLASCTETASWLSRAEAAASELRQVQRATNLHRLLRAEGACARWLKGPAGTSNNSSKPTPLRGAA